VPSCDKVLAAILRHRPRPARWPRAKPGCHELDDHRRLRRLELQPNPIVEARAAEALRRDRACDQGLPLPSRDQQVERNRAPAVTARLRSRDQIPVEDPSPKNQPDLRPPRCSSPTASHLVRSVIFLTLPRYPSTLTRVAPSAAAMARGQRRCSRIASAPAAPRPSRSARRHRWRSRGGREPDVRGPTQPTSASSDQWRTSWLSVAPEQRERSTSQRLRDCLSAPDCRSGQVLGALSALRAIAGTGASSPIACSRSSLPSPC
jgi:hypothetical protein